MGFNHISRWNFNLIGPTDNRRAKCIIRTLNSYMIVSPYGKLTPFGPGVSPGEKVAVVSGVFATGDSSQFVSSRNSFGFRYEKKGHG